MNMSVKNCSKVVLYIEMNDESVRDEAVASDDEVDETLREMRVKT